jgi:hypothetical protein
MSSLLSYAAVVCNSLKHDEDIPTVKKEELTTDVIVSESSIPQEHEIKTTIDSPVIIQPNSSTIIELIKSFKPNKTQPVGISSEQLQFWADLHNQLRRLVPDLVYAIENNLAYSPDSITVDQLQSLKIIYNNAFCWINDDDHHQQTNFINPSYQITLDQLFQALYYSPSATMCSLHMKREFIRLNQSYVLLNQSFLGEVFPTLGFVFILETLLNFVHSRSYVTCLMN